MFKLTIPGPDERDVRLTKRQYFNSSTPTSAINITANTNTTTVTNITTLPKGIKVEFPEIFFRVEGEPYQNTLSVCRLQKGHISNISGTVLCVKLKLTVLVVRDVELNKIQ